MKYKFTKVRELELLAISYSIFSEKNPKTLSEIFSIDIEYHQVEEFFIQTCLLSLFKFGYVDLSGNYGNPEPFKGGFVEVNPIYSYKVINNVTNIIIDNFYPSLIIDCDEEEISNVKGMKEFFKDLFLFYRKNKNDLDLIIKNKIKIYINFMYGTLSNLDNKSYIKTNINISRISNKARNILLKIKKEFEGHYVYLDTYEIYFHHFNEIKERFNIYFDKCQTSFKCPTLRFSKEEYEKGIFLKKKKMILSNENIYTKGFPTI